MDVGTEQGPVECPYCGHQIAERVKYTGQELYCQKCTSACTAPTYAQHLDLKLLAEEKAEVKAWEESPMRIRLLAEKAELRQAEIDERICIGSTIWVIGLGVALLFSISGTYSLSLDSPQGEVPWFLVVVDLVFFCLFLWSLWAALPRKYFSKEAKRRAEKRKAEGYWDKRIRSWFRTPE